MGSQREGLPLLRGRGEEEAVTTARQGGRLLLAVLMSAFLCTAAGAAPAQLDEEQTCGGSCDGDPECTLLVATCLLAREEYRPALAELKASHERHPDDGRLVRLMALAYQGLGNSAWAVKRLLAHLDRQPLDVQTRSWATWLLLQEGDLVRAEKLLEEAPAPEPGAALERTTLLYAAIADLRGDRDAAEAELRKVMRRRGSLFPEDRLLLRHLRARIRGDSGRPLSVRVQLSGGYTSNAIQNSPTDPGAGAEADETTGSPLAGVDAVVRFEPWTSRWIRPTAELRGKALGQASGVARDYSYVDLGGRAGLDLGDRGPHVAVAYSVELLGVHGGDVYRDTGPRWFMEAHRAELEFVPVAQVQVFSGVGRRIYRELPRTRTEADGGVAVVLDSTGGWNLTGIATGRYHDARHEAFDGFGVTGLVRLAVPLPRHALIKVKGMVVGDRYPDSANYYLSEEPRDDVLVKVQAGLWTPPLGGLRIGVTYTFTGRHSTVDSYTYADHRLQVELRWGGAWDPLAPREVSPPQEHITLPYGLGTRDDSGLDRVQDLLRQEDSARKGSTCVD